MAITVTKLGHKTGEQPVQFVCEGCGCEWSATRPDYRYVENHPASYYESNCPNCSNVDKQLA